MCSGIWSVATTRIDFWTLIWSGRKQLLDFNARKTQLVLFDCSNNTGAVDVKMDGLFLRKINLLRFWGWLLLSNWIGALTLFLLLKLPPRKLEPWFVLWILFLLRLLWIFINLPYGHAWNIIFMSGLVLLVPIRNCWISYKNGYAGLLVLQLLPLLKPWLIVKMQLAKVFSIAIV